MFLKIYWNKKSKEILIPTIAKAEAGYWLNVEPVERLGSDDTESLLEALTRTAERSGRVVPTPSRASFSQPVLLSYSSAKSLSAFEKQYSQVSVDKPGDGHFRINGYRKSPEGSGYLPDEALGVTLPNGSSLEDVAKTIMTIIRNT